MSTNRHGSFGSLFALVVLASLLAGCANFRRLRSDLRKLEKTSRLTGKVVAGEWTGQPIQVYLMTIDESVGKPTRASELVTLKEPGDYQFWVEPGAYALGAVEDIDNNGEYDVGEPVAVFNDLEILNVGANQKFKRLNMLLLKETPEALEGLEPKSVTADFRLHAGVVASLSDDRFDPKLGPFGMWEPYKFYQQYGAGIYMLQPYSDRHTPVLFIHGMSGHPREFEPIIAAVDTEKFQPWVVQYPSGARLQDVTDAILGMLETMHAKHDFERLCIVSHSMGGVVAHHLVRDHAERGMAPYIRYLATIDSPLGGMKSADVGVKMAPGVVPSWRDVGPKSEFMKALFKRPFPENITYSLYFGYGATKASDGAVALNSQLIPAAQESARSVAGYEETHTGILRKDRVIKRITLDLGLCLDNE